MPRMNFKFDISIGELLTVFSIAGSAVSFLWSWSNERDLQIREKADKIRTEAAMALGKVQRTRDIYLSFYNEIQGDIEDVTTLLGKTGSTVAARDLYWKKFKERESETQRRILDDFVETAYVGLLPYDPGIDSVYQETMGKLKKLSHNEMRLLLQETEALVLEYKGPVSQPALMGNELRGVIAKYREEHAENQTIGSHSLEMHLKSLIRKPDKLLLDGGSW